MPTPRRSVSQIAAGLEALAQPSPFENSKSGSVSLSPSRPAMEKDKGSRRVTMPPVYSQPGGPLYKEGGGAGGWTIPTVQPRRASVQVKFDGGYPTLPDKGVASPTPKRSDRLSTMGIGFELEDK
jgi:hypothetical protein